MSENGKKILVIDDEAHIRNVIALKLKKRGYQVMLAVNGEDGFNMIKQERPSIVISDIHMPKMDGRSLCEKSREFKFNEQAVKVSFQDPCRLGRFLGIYDQPRQALQSIPDSWVISEKCHNPAVKGQAQAYLQQAG